MQIPNDIKKESQGIILNKDHLNTSSNDIEMLSAKSVDGGQHVGVIGQIGVNEVKDEIKKEEGYTTISSDTKALLKSSLMNACFKKRNGIYLITRC